jgi:hypothetical protein
VPSVVRVVGRACRRSCVSSVVRVFRHVDPEVRQQSGARGRQGVGITTGVQLRGPEGAQRLRASSAATSELGIARLQLPLHLFGIRGVQSNPQGESLVL